MEELVGLLEDLPEKERKGIDLDRAEEALHLALTLWALHQQSHRDTDMHVRGRGLGAGVRQLMRLKTGSADGAPATGKPASRAEDEIDEPLRRRFVRVSTANSLESLAQRLREIVLLLRRETVPLDYGLLADQLYRWQWPNGRAGVHRAWGRDFHLAGYRRRENAESASGASRGGRGGPQDPATPYSDYGPYGPGD